MFKVSNRDSRTTSIDLVLSLLLALTRYLLNEQKVLMFRISLSEAYLELCHISGMECFAKIVNGF